MKVIISHDIDHISVLEHKTDLIIPKFIVRMNIELILGKISLKEYFLRYKNLFKNKWNNIEELMEFNKKNNIPATFFIGVNNGVGLNYNIDLTKKWTKKILVQGFDCGVHGIDFENFDDIKKEYDTFKEISGLNEFGIRMHYLRNDTKTLSYLAEAGYIFDTTDMSINKVYNIDNMLEFPLHIMDGVVCGNRKIGSKTLKEAQKETIDFIEKVKKEKSKYLTILFHDRYFDDSFKVWKEWYIWTIKYLKDNKYEFVNFKNAVNNIKTK